MPELMRKNRERERKGTNRARTQRESQRKGKKEPIVLKLNRKIDGKSKMPDPISKIGHPADFQITKPT
jgi:hypothetical protein